MLSARIDPALLFRNGCFKKNGLSANDPMEDIDDQKNDINSSEPRQNGNKK